MLTTEGRATSPEPSGQTAAGFSTTAPESPPGSWTATSTRREALLTAAIRLFNQHGYHAVSMEDIGAAVGITSASVYNHFTSKSDLLVGAPHPRGRQPQTRHVPRLGRRDTTRWTPTSGSPCPTATCSARWCPR